MKRINALTLIIISAAALMGCPKYPVVNKVYDTAYAENSQNQQLKVAVWYPLSQEQHRLIAFSHGFFSSPLLYDDFLRSLAADGFIVIAPFHNDGISLFSEGQEDEMSQNLWRLIDGVGSVFDNMRSMPNHGNDGLTDAIAVAFGQGDEEELNCPEIKNEIKKIFNYRTRELSAAIELVIGLGQTSGNEFSGRVNEDAIGLASHSFGGYTTLELVLDDSASPRNFGAVLMLSSVSALSDMSRLKVPTCFLTGTVDDQAIYETSKKAYQTTAGPSYFMSFDKVGHLTFCAAAVIANQLSATLLGNDGNQSDNWLLKQKDIIACSDYPQKSMAIQKASLEFFQQYLNGSNNVLDGSQFKNLNEFLRK